jgi:hypothetical protein
MSDRTNWTCADCGDTIVHSIVEGKHRFEHNLTRGQHDHEPVPVSAEVMAGRAFCDFCNHRDPEWLCRWNPFLLSGDPVWSDDGLYLVCTRCRDLLNDGDWDTLSSFAINDLGPGHEAGVKMLHAALQVQGEPIITHLKDTTLASTVRSE